jgi:phosphopantetheinyl transferase
MDLSLLAYDNTKTDFSPEAFFLHALQGFCGLETLPQIARTAKGKPFFPDCPNLHFNISHSGSLFLLGIASAPIGVDIEKLRPRRPALPRFALTDEEYAVFEAKGGSWKAFYALWTAKEAYCKYTGEGLSRPSHLSVPPKTPLKTFLGEQYCATVVCDRLEENTELCWL